MALQSIPNIRNILSSLKKKDRFQASTPNDGMKVKYRSPAGPGRIVSKQKSPNNRFQDSPRRNNKQSAISQLGDYLTRLEKVDRNAIVNRSI